MSSVTNTGQNDKPRNFQEAWYDQNKERRQNWRVAIRKEFKDMIRRGVWDVVERSSIPEGRRLIGYKEVYEDPGNYKVLVLRMAMYGLLQAARQ